MRYSLTIIFTLLATTAQAHPGHLADLAGHDHWVAGAAIGLAILTGLYGALKGQKEIAEPENQEETDAEEVPA